MENDSFKMFNKYRMRPLGLNYDSSEVADQLGELAFLALEDICNET